MEEQYRILARATLSRNHGPRFGALASPLSRDHTVSSAWLTSPWETSNPECLGVSAAVALPFLLKMYRRRQKRKAASKCDAGAEANKKPGLKDVFRILKLVWPKFSKVFSGDDEGAGAGYFLCLLFFAS